MIDIIFFLFYGIVYIPYSGLLNPNHKFILSLFNNDNIILNVDIPTMSIKYDLA